MNDEISGEVKRAIVEQELTLWRNTLYQLQLRHRVNKKVGASEAALKVIENEMIKCEATLDALKEELETLT